MPSENEYTALIAGSHVGKPLFTKWVYTLTDPLLQARERLAQMVQDFDVDTAVGPQLDAIGVRVGIGRELPLKLTDVYFALDDVDGIGLDLGVWKGPYDPGDGLVSLGDDTYRAVIKAKILANSWNGQNGTLPDLISQTLALFGIQSKILDMQDKQTMHVAIHLSRSGTPPVVWDLISRRIIDITAAGVSLQIVNNDPWFGLDNDTASVKGLDEGYWFPFEE